MYNHLEGIVKSEIDANRDEKEFNPWSDYTDSGSFGFSQNKTVPDFEKDFKEAKAFSLAHEVDEPFFKLYATNIKFKREQGEDHWEDNARMKFERKRLPEYYLYKFDKYSLEDIAMKQMDGRNGEDNDITRVTSPEETFMNLYFQQQFETERPDRINNITKEIDSIQETNEENTLKKIALTKKREHEKIKVMGVAEKTALKNEFNTLTKESEKIPLNAKIDSIQKIEHHLMQLSPTQLMNTAPMPAIQLINALSKNNKVAPLSITSTNETLLRRINQLNKVNNIKLVSEVSKIQAMVRGRASRSQSKPSLPIEGAEESKSSGRRRRASSSLTADEENEIETIFSSPQGSKRSEEGKGDEGDVEVVIPEEVKGLKYFSNEKDAIEAMHNVFTRNNKLSPEEIYQGTLSIKNALSKTHSEWSDIKDKVYDYIDSFAGRRFATKQEAIPFINDLEKSLKTPSWVEQAKTFKPATMTTRSMSTS